MRPRTRACDGRGGSRTPPTARQRLLPPRPRPATTPASPCVHPLRSAAGAVTFSALEGHSGSDSAQTLATVIVRCDFGGWVSRRSYFHRTTQVCVPASSQPRVDAWAGGGGRGPGGGGEAPCRERPLETGLTPPPLPPPPPFGPLSLALQLLGMETGLMERLMMGLLTVKDEVEFGRCVPPPRTPAHPKTTCLAWGRVGQASGLGPLRPWV